MVTGLIFGFTAGVCTVLLALWLLVHFVSKAARYEVEEQCQGECIGEDPLMEKNGSLL